MAIRKHKSRDRSFPLTNLATIPEMHAYYTVHEAVESIGFGRFQWLLSAAAGFSWIADSMEIMLLSLLVPSLVCEWNISVYEQALCTMCMFAGWMLFSSVWGAVCDRFGRRTGLFITSVMGCVFGIASACSPSFTWFVIFRTLVGVAMGGCSQSVTIMMEFLPTSKRSAGACMLAVFWAAGAATTVLIAMAITPWLGWRGVVVFCSLPLGIFAVIAVFWLPESARYYVTRGETAKATAVLRRIAAINGGSLPEGDLVTDAEPTDENKCMALLAAGRRRLTIFVWICWAGATFSYYGLTLTTTKMFSSTDECHGGDPHRVINATAHCSPLTSGDYVDMLISSVAELPGLAVAFLLLDRIGRKSTISLMLAVFAAANIVMYFCLSRALIVVFLFIARAMINGAAQSLYIYTPEVYPTTMRAIGVGMGSTFGRLGAIFTPTIAQILADWNMGAAMLIYGGVGLICSAVALLFPVETAGRELKDVQ